MCLGFLLRKQALCLSCWALCALMFCVGVSIGNDPQTLRNFRSLNPRLVFLPAMTILGTFAGCAVANLFLPHRSMTDCMAVGAGFGYYSLSSIFITEYKGAELGTIAEWINETAGTKTRQSDIATRANETDCPIQNTTIVPCYIDPAAVFEKHKGITIDADKRETLKPRYTSGKVGSADISGW